MVVRDRTSLHMDHGVVGKFDPHNFPYLSDLRSGSGEGDSDSESLKILTSLPSYSRGVAWRETRGMQNIASELH